MELVNNKDMIKDTLDAWEANRLKTTRENFDTQVEEFKKHFPEGFLEKHSGQYFYEPNGVVYFAFAYDDETEVQYRVYTNEITATIIIDKDKSVISFLISEFNFAYGIFKHIEDKIDQLKEERSTRAERKLKEELEKPLTTVEKLAFEIYKNNLGHFDWKLKLEPIKNSQILAEQFLRKVRNL